jgi:hypothetical protein
MNNKDQRTSNEKAATAAHPHSDQAVAYQLNDLHSACQTRGRAYLFGALALTFGTLALTLAAISANAEITQDCIIEGTVDMRRAEQLGQPYYVSFSNASHGSEARCMMNRRTKSRRVQFVDTPRMDGIENAVDGSKVRYRYIERNGQPGHWELIEVRDPRGS